MKKAKKLAQLPRRKKPFGPRPKLKRIPHYDSCKDRWEKARKERKALFTEAQRGKPNHKDEWKTGFVTPDSVASAKSGGVLLKSVATPCLNDGVRKSAFCVSVDWRKP